MGKHQRDKGRRFEQRIARDLREIWPDAQRQWHHGRDVDAGPLHVECKHRQRIDVRGALQQAVADARPGQMPCAVVLWHGDPEPVVALRWGDWLDMMREWKGEAT